MESLPEVDADRCGAFFFVVVGDVWGFAVVDGGCWIYLGDRATTGIWRSW